MLPSTEALLMSLYSHVAVSSKRSRNSENHKTWLNKEMPGLLYLLQTEKLLAWLWLMGKRDLVGQSPDAPVSSASSKDLPALELMCAQSQFYRGYYLDENSCQNISLKDSQ